MFLRQQMHRWTESILNVKKWNVKVRGNNVAWKKSVLTGKIDGETVYPSHKIWYT